MISRFQCRRLVALGFLLTLAFVCLGYRLVDLQVLQHDRFREASEEKTHRMLLRAPKRGDVRDVRWNLLAGSVFVKTVCANPAVIGERRYEVARVLAPLLQLTEAEIVQRLQVRLRTNDQGQLATNSYVVLKRKVPVETWEQVQTAMKSLPVGTDLRALPKKERDFYTVLREQAVFTAPLDDQVRIYPNRQLAAHILGYVGAGQTDTPKGKLYESLEGKDGIEQTLDAALKGVVGWRTTEVVRKQEVVASREQDVEAHAGRNVILCIDSGVQHILESELTEVMQKHTPISASGIVMRPRTGEILAMATYPSFDPNDLANSAADARRNRVICDMAEPGSTFKIVVISGAINDGLISMEDKFDCENGSFVFAGKRLHDHERYGVLTVEEIITHSSNIGAAKVGIKMGQERLYQYIRAFGFGTRTGVPLVGEVPGEVPINRWTKLSISRVPMGHEVAVTPLQMTMAMAAVANGGRLMRPMLIDRLEDEEGHVLFKNYPQQVRQVISERAARLMVGALKTVVSTNGTGKRAMLEHYTAAGKTGTAQKFIGGAYRRDKHFSSFIGFFPADAPEVCVAVFLDEPKNGYYGGEAAAPVFRDISERVGKDLAIAPDVVPSAPSPGGTMTTVSR